MTTDIKDSHVKVFVVDLFNIEANKSGDSVRALFS